VELFDIGGIVDHHRLEVVVCFVDIGGINDHRYLAELTEHKKVKIQHCSKVKLVNGNFNPTRLIAGSPAARFIDYISVKIYSKVLILHDSTETKQ
jgi:hypothetical protein